MKLTESRIRDIIREEISNLNERGDLLADLEMLLANEGIPYEREGGTLYVRLGLKSIQFSSDGTFTVK